jgi:cathepsin F
VIEGAWVLAGHKLVSLSEQQLIDCDKKDSACNGGDQTIALSYVMRNGGIEGESDYKKYSHKKHKCTFDKKKVEAKIKSWKQMSKNEPTLASQVATVGPVTIGINADNMQLYQRGVASPSKKRCKQSINALDHAVLIVGFDRSATKPYWIIKNSWGTDWGEKGYYRAEFGKGICGLNKDVQAAFA